MGIPWGRVSGSRAGGERQRKADEWGVVFFNLRKGNGKAGHRLDTVFALCWPPDTGGLRTETLPPWQRFVPKISKFESFREQVVTEAWLPESVHSMHSVHLGSGCFQETKQGSSSPQHPQHFHDWQLLVTRRCLCFSRWWSSQCLGHQPLPFRLSFWEDLWKGWA